MKDNGSQTTNRCIVHDSYVPNGGDCPLCSGSGFETKTNDPVLAKIKLARAIGRLDGLTEAANLCDQLYEGERGVWIGVDEVADKIRDLARTQ